MRGACRHWRSKPSSGRIHDTAGAVQVCAEVQAPAGSSSYGAESQQMGTVLNSSVVAFGFSRRTVETREGRDEAVTRWLLLEGVVSSAFVSALFHLQFAS